MAVQCSGPFFELFFLKRFQNPDIWLEWKTRGQFLRLDDTWNHFLKWITPRHSSSSSGPLQGQPVRSSKALEQRWAMLEGRSKPVGMLNPNQGPPRRAAPTGCEPPGVSPLRLLVTGDLRAGAGVGGSGRPCWHCPRPNPGRCLSSPAVHAASPHSATTAGVCTNHPCCPASTTHLGVQAAVSGEAGPTPAHSGGWAFAVTRVTREHPLFSGEWGWSTWMAAKAECARSHEWTIFACFF